MIIGVLILTAVIILIVLVLIYRTQALLAVSKGESKPGTGLSNKVNAFLLVFFGIVGFGLFFWYTFLRADDYMLPEASSVHGVVTDGLFWFTMLVLIIAFVITHILIVLFVAKYQYKEGREVKFFPESDKLEMAWTILPAIVLTILIFRGFKTWTDITTIPELTDGTERVVVEVVGEQFKWSIRYPGADGKLGAHDFRKINAVNPFGMDLSDVNSIDDIVAQEIHLPVNTPVLFRIRAKDVLHSVFAPHFRVKMDAVPGMPTQFLFTPTKTTEEMREELSKDPKFQVLNANGKPLYEVFHYELTCTEICGKSHFAMKNKIIVHTEEEYKEWLKAQTPWTLSESDNGMEVKSDIVKLVDSENMEAFSTRVKELGATISTK